MSDSGIMYDAANAEEYGEFQENGFKECVGCSLSYGWWRHTSYSSMRHFINKGGTTRSVDAIRTEKASELLFYDYSEAKQEVILWKLRWNPGPAPLEHKPSSCTYRPEKRKETRRIICLHLIQVWLDWCLPVLWEPAVGLVKSSLLNYW